MSVTDCSTTNKQEQQLGGISSTFFDKVSTFSTKFAKGSINKNAIKVNMEVNERLGSGSGGSRGGPVLFHEANAVFKIPVSNKWSVFGTSQIQVKTNHTTRIVIGLLAVFVVTAFVLNGRVQMLVDRNGALEEQIGLLEERMKFVMEEMNRLNLKQGTNTDNHAEVPSGPEKTLELLKDNGIKSREKRAVNEIPRQFLPSGSSSSSSRVPVIGVNEFKNGGNESYSGNIGGGGRTLRALPNEPQQPKQELLGGGSSTPRKGKFPPSPSKRHFCKCKCTNNDNLVPRLRERYETRLAKLKLRLQIAKERANSVNLQLKALKAQLSSIRYEQRAAYLTVRDPNIHIENSKQRIGPWYIADSGKDIGFNDLWYQNLDLDENGTSVMFQESGLYLIYAQVYYVTASTGSKNQSPLGFRIYLNKETSNSSVFRRPIPIAECVPSFPSTFYQTCFTQICWYVEKGDSVYLEHFTKARPVISSEEMGQTFLGIVRLTQ